MLGGDTIFRMDTEELDSCLKYKVGDKVNYIGIFTSDDVGNMKIDSGRTKPIIFIANTLTRADDVKVMGHWVCFYIEKSPFNDVIFFDSYGLNPRLYCKGFESFISINKSFSIHDFGMQLQPTESYKCGLYAVFFIHYTSLCGINETVMKIKNTFSIYNTYSNDRYVTRYYLTHLSKRLCSQWMKGYNRAITYKECLSVINHRR